MGSRSCKCLLNCNQPGSRSRPLDLNAVAYYSSFELLSLGRRLYTRRLEGGLNVASDSQQQSRLCRQHRCETGRTEPSSYNRILVFCYTDTLQLWRFQATIQLVILLRLTLTGFYP